MSSGRKIILHIGLPKTGTSTIQNVLHANRDLLLAHDGALYPSVAPSLNTSLGTIFRTNPQRQRFNEIKGFTTEEIASRRQSYLDSLDAEISSREWNSLLLSAEAISNLTAPETARLREWGETFSSDWVVLVCVRHPVDWTRSVVQQQLKRGDTLHQLYEKLPMPNYRAKISRAISVFGRENVRVFDLEGATQSEGGLVGTFARLAGLSASSRDLLVSRAVRANESLSLEGARILDSLNRQRPMFVGDVRAPRRAGPGRELGYLRRIEGRKFDVPDSVKEEVRSGSREDVGWLNETFGLELYGDVTEDLPPGAQSHQAAEETLSERAIDTIAGILGELMAEATFQRLLDRGEEAMSRGNLGRAEVLLREAARLDPDARQPRKLLEEVTAQQPGNAGEPGPKEKTGKRANRASFLNLAHRLWNSWARSR